MKNFFFKKKGKIDTLLPQLAKNGRRPTLIKSEEKEDVTMDITEIKKESSGVIINIYMPTNWKI